MSVLVVLDVDSTLIQQEVIELLAELAGALPEIKSMTELAMAGELDFEKSLVRRVELLAGLPVAALQDVQALITLTPGVKDLISTVHGMGGKVGAVSGGFSQILSPLAERIGLDFAMANELEVLDEKLTGKITGPVVDAAAKASALASWAKQMNLPLEKTIAVGDGANDIEMLLASGYSVAFRPKPVLREYADLIIEKNSMSELVEKLLSGTR